jgi:hypothetical protein
VMRWLMTLTLVGLFCNACSADTAPQEDASPISTLRSQCAFLSRGEVADVTGSRVIKVENLISRVTLEKSGCLYRTDGPFGAIVVDMDVSGGARFDDWLEREARPEAHYVVEHVSGLGDEAYLIGRTGMFVRKGSAVFHVGSDYLPPDGPAVLRALAEIALPRF